MIKATTEQIQNFSAAIAAMQDGKVIIAEIDGMKLAVTRLYFGADTMQGPLHNFDRLHIFDDVQSAKSFLKAGDIGEPDELDIASAAFSPPA